MQQGNDGRGGSSCKSQKATSDQVDVDGGGTADDEADLSDDEADPFDLSDDEGDPSTTSKMAARTRTARAALKKKETERKKKEAARSKRSRRDSDATRTTAGESSSDDELKASPKKKMTTPKKQAGSKKQTDPKKHTDPKKQDTDESEPEHSLSEYELLVKQNIKKNEERLKALGLDKKSYQERFGKKQPKKQAGSKKKKTGTPKKISAKNAVRCSPRSAGIVLPSQRAKAAGIIPVDYSKIKKTKKDRDIAQAVLRVANDDRVTERSEGRIRRIVAILLSEETSWTLADYHALYNKSGTRHMYIVHNDTYGKLKGDDDQARLSDLLKRNKFIPGLHYFIDEDSGSHSFDLYLEHIGFTF